jgi:hypothetical protein
MLARQLLLARSPAPLTRALERLGGLQTQYAPSGYVGLWSRLRDFDGAALTRALERRSAVQGTMMRVTIHTVSARDYWPLTEGVRLARRRWWLRAAGAEARELDMVAVARRVRSMLRAGPRRSNELMQELEAAGLPRAAWTGVGLWLDLVRVPPSGTWHRRRADLFGLAEQWVPRDGKPTSEQGHELLLRRYLGGFGPASLADAAAWAGLAVGELRPAAERMRLRRFRDEAGRQLLDLPGAPLPGADASVPVRFLPTFDATLLASTRRTRILPEEYRPLVFDVRTPHSVGTYLVDGTVAGGWRQVDGRIELQRFHPLPRAAGRELESETAALAVFHEATSATA